MYTSIITKLQVEYCWQIFQYGEQIASGMCESEHQAALAIENWYRSN